MANMCRSTVTRKCGSIDCLVKLLVSNVVYLTNVVRSWIKKAPQTAKIGVIKGK